MAYLSLDFPMDPTPKDKMPAQTSSPLFSADGARTTLQVGDALIINFGGKVIEFYRKETRIGGTIPADFIFKSHENDGIELAQRLVNLLAMVSGATFELNMDACLVSRGYTYTVMATS